MGKRLHTLDLIRGILFINMIGYHWQYISGFISGNGVTLTSAERIWQLFICVPFILLAGFCAGMTQHVLKNAAKVLACGMVITVGSFIIMPDYTVWFGILTLIGAGYLSVYLLDEHVKKLPQLPLLIGFVAVFVLLYPYRFGQSHAADYFPFVPWLFLFWSGRTLQRLLGDRPKQWRWMQWKLPVLNFLGQHTLVGYLVHLPVLAAIALLMQ